MIPRWPSHEINMFLYSMDSEEGRSAHFPLFVGVGPDVHRYAYNFSKLDIPQLWVGGGIE